jgi:signal recognition particle subunit SEC65
MNIHKILELNYQNQQWAVGEDYDSLTWDEGNSILKPSREELETIWNSLEFKSKMQNDDANFHRKIEILSKWPIHKQFEAITEFHMNRTEKMNELISFINETKQKYPKTQTL